MKVLVLISTVFLLMGCSAASTTKAKNDTPSFSFEELLTAEKVPLPPLQYLEASDKTRLAFREYVPQKTDAILLFYHGGGTYSTGGYEHIGDGLSQHFNVLVVTPDIRGHGDSDGEKGDSPSVEQVFDDIGVFIGYIRKKYPDKTLFLGGHSSGGGLVLNYSGFKRHKAVNGYLFLSPNLGFRSKTEVENNPNPFATVNTSLFVKNAIFGTNGNSKAVHFNYSKEILSTSKNIDAITVNMANSQTPSAPKEQLQALNLPVALWIGENDEVLNASKVATFFEKNSPASFRRIVKNEKHVSILLTASHQMGPWIQQIAR